VNMFASVGRHRLKGLSLILTIHFSRLSTTNIKKQSRK
jgi:hypothetical protein